MTSGKALLTDSSDLRIVLIGKVNSGKTSVMRTFVRSSEGSAKRPEGILMETETSYKEELTIGGQKVVVVDTPGLCHADKTDQEILEEIKKGVSLASPGPHVFLLVMALNRYTEEEKEMVELIKKTFTENVLNYILVLFTGGDQLNAKGKTVQEFVKDSDELNSFVSGCNGGYCAIDNKETQDQSQVTELLHEIKTTVERNKGGCYKDVGGQNRAGLVKRIALAVNGSAVVGAGMGGVVSHFVASAVGIPVGMVAGAAVGGVVGGVGIVTAEHIRAKTKKNCVLQ